MICCVVGGVLIRIRLERCSNATASSIGVVMWCARSAWNGAKSTLASERDILNMTGYYVFVNKRDEFSLTYVIYGQLIISL